MDESSTKNFYELTPDKVLDAIEEVGVRCTGRVLALNSMENRVYQAEIEVAEEEVTSPADRYCVAKFYRPGRWSKEQILAEHTFLKELHGADIPAVAPLSFPDGETLHKFDETDIFFTVFPKVQGRNLDELTREQLERIGRLIARVHLVGSSSPAKSRLTLGPDSYGYQSIEYLRTSTCIPETFRDQFLQLSTALCDHFAPRFTDAPLQRIHGDCHVGNVLWKDDFCFLVDFDDFLNGPPVQDLWLLTPGRDEDSLERREILLKGYEQLVKFDRGTLDLVEPLRTLRIIYFCAWIAKRYEDPSFARTFPDFTSEPYWRDIVVTLQEQQRIIQYGAAEW